MGGAPNSPAPNSSRTAPARRPRILSASDHDRIKPRPCSNQAPPPFRRAPCGCRLRFPAPCRPSSISFGRASAAQRSASERQSRGLRAGLRQRFPPQFACVTASLLQPHSHANSGPHSAPTAAVGLILLPAPPRLYLRRGRGSGASPPPAAVPAPGRVGRWGAREPRGALRIRRYFAPAGPTGGASCRPAYSAELPAGTGLARNGAARGAGSAERLSSSSSSSHMAATGGCFSRECFSSNNSIFSWPFLPSQRLFLSLSVYGSAGVAAANDWGRGAPLVLLQ